MGAGASVEAGIPPLHSLHQLYHVSEGNSHKFLLGPKEDRLLLDIALDPSSFYRKVGEIYKKALTLKITPFYHLLKTLYDDNKIVGSVITNNFDRLVTAVGLPEKYVRRYDEAHITPDIKFHNKAKSLIVFGSHADRRRIQHAARESGLQVIYVDPEGYTFPTGFRPYPLESVQDEDLLVNMTMGEFTEAWHEAHN